MAMQRDRGIGEGTKVKGTLALMPGKGHLLATFKSKEHILQQTLSAGSRAIKLPLADRETSCPLRRWVFQLRPQICAWAEAKLDLLHQTHIEVRMLEEGYPETEGSTLGQSGWGGDGITKTKSWRCLMLGSGARWGLAWTCGHGEPLRGLRGRVSSLISGSILDIQGKAGVQQGRGMSKKAEKVCWPVCT